MKHEDRRALEQLIAEVRRAAQGEDVTAIRDAMNHLQQATYACRLPLRNAHRRAPSPGTATGTATAAALSRCAGEDVVEGEFRRV